MGDLIQFVPPRDAAPSEENVIEWQRLAVLEAIVGDGHVYFADDDKVYWYPVETCSRCDNPLYLHPFGWTELCVCRESWTRRETATGRHLTSIPSVYVAPKRIEPMSYKEMKAKLEAFWTDDQALLAASDKVGGEPT